MSNLTDHLSEFVETPKLFDLTGLLRRTEAANPPIYPLISSNQGGLMNRLTCLLSTIHVSERSNHTAYAWWTRNRHSMGMLDELFDPERSGFREIEYEHAVEAAMHTTYFSPHTLELNKAKTIIHTIEPLTTAPPIPHGFFEIGQIFKRFHPSPFVEGRLRPFDDTDFSQIIGFHVRMPYSNNAFSDMEQAKFRLGSNVFSRIIEDILTRIGDSRIMLCTNSEEMETILKGRFGSAIMTHKKTSTDNTTNPIAVQEALVDLILLSKCRHVISQHRSGFGFLAAAIGGRSALQITQDSSEDDYRISHTEGEKQIFINVLDYISR